MGENAVFAAPILKNDCVSRRVQLESTLVRKINNYNGRIRSFPQSFSITSPSLYRIGSVYDCIASEQQFSNGSCLC